MNFSRTLKKSSAALALVLLVGFGFGANVHGLAQTDPSGATPAPVDNSVYHSDATTTDADTMTSSDMPASTGNDGQQITPLSTESAPTDDSQAAQSGVIMQNSAPQTDKTTEKPVSATKSLILIVGSMVVASLAVALIFYIVLSRKKLPTSKKKPQLKI